jgi:hypothetical protein
LQIQFQFLQNMHVAIFYLMLSAHHPFLITRQRVQQVAVRPDPLDLRAQQAPLEQLVQLVSAALQGLQEPQVNLV